MRQSDGERGREGIRGNEREGGREKGRNGKENVQRECGKGRKGGGRRKRGRGERGLESRNTLSLFFWVVQPLGPEISRIHHLNWILVSSGMCE